MDQEFEKTQEHNLAASLSSHVQLDLKNRSWAYLSVLLFELLLQVAH